MRMIFGVLSLLAVLAVVAMLSNKQLKAVNNFTVPSSNPDLPPTCQLYDQESLSAG